MARLVDTRQYPGVTTREIAHEIQLSWQPEAVDYVEAFKARNRDRKVGGKLILLFLGGVGFAGAAFAADQPGPACLVLIVAAIPLVMSAIIVKTSSNALWRDHDDLHTPSRAVLTTSGISIDGPVVDLRNGPMTTTRMPHWLPWPFVQNVLETKHVFVVHLVGYEGKGFFLLAKRGLDGATELAALRAALAQAGRAR